MSHTVTNGAYALTDDVQLVQQHLETLCDLVTKQHWGTRRSRRTTRHSFEQSRVFLLLHGQTLAGCCRVLSDESILGYFEDVIIDTPHRRKGLGQWMIATVMQWPNLREVHRWLLDTEDMQAFYQSIGFAPVPYPQRYLELVQPYPAQ